MCKYYSHTLGTVLHRVQFSVDEPLYKYYNLKGVVTSKTSTLRPIIIYGVLVGQDNHVVSALILVVVSRNRPSSVCPVAMAVTMLSHMLVA